MTVELAGYNFDVRAYDELHKTPETLCAAYARISRSSASIAELRREALEEVEKARISNERILFEMGHSSIAEHAVFNFDLVDVSRYLAELVQRTRLASFTEKSQRYVTFASNFFTPAEICDTELEKEYKAYCEESFALYHKVFSALKDKLSTSELKKKELEGQAKEDARYLLPLAVKTQMGMTVNARSLEKLLRRLDGSELEEAGELREKLLLKVVNLAPSVIRYTKATPWEKTIAAYRAEQTWKEEKTVVKLIAAPRDAEAKILSAFHFERGGGSYEELFCYFSQLSADEKEKYFHRIFSGMQNYQLPPRAFEICDFQFELSLSASCFAQFKRHRLVSMFKEPYQPVCGFILPPSVAELKNEILKKEIDEHLKNTEIIYTKLEKIKQGLGNYIILNGHRTRVLVKANLRELYHIVRLRSDKHAQWEIRQISCALAAAIKKEAPLAAAYLSGKHEFKPVEG